MSDEERNEILAKLVKAAKEAKHLTADQALQQLIDRGIYMANGEMSAQYSGEILPAE